MPGRLTARVGRRRLDSESQATFPTGGVIALTTLILFCARAGLAADADANWPQFRGPAATGTVAGQTQLPDTWSATENIAWKTDIPGRGWSSPVVWGSRVFLTTVVNLGESEEPKKGLYFGGNRTKPPESVHRWILLCLSLDTGEILWQKQVHEGMPATAIHLKNSFASETPVTDGMHLYALFGGVGVYCFDLEGNEVWTKTIEPHKMRYGWGTAASPVLHGDRLYIVNDNDEDSYLLALDKGTGEEVWRVARDEKSNWATPYIWQNGERTEIVTPGTGKVRSYDLDGTLRWWLTGMSSITIATPYEHAGLLYVSSGYVMDKSRPLYAIRPGAQGDISLAEDQKSNASIAWCQPQAGPYNPTSLAYKGTIYVLYDRGFLAAYNAADGAQIYEKTRIPDGRAFTASPWAYDGKLFCLNEDGKTFVIEAGDKLEVLRVNSLADDDMVMSTPAIAGERLLIRTSARVYCVRDATRE
jgi:outer membrane protein assembly factor BamB